MRFKRLLALLFLLIPSLGFGQSSFYHYQTTVRNKVGNIVAAPTVRVCIEPATGATCIPLATIYSDPGLTQPLSNPFSGGSDGTVSFYGSDSQIHVQINGFGISQIDLPYANVVATSINAVVNDSNVTGAISAQTLTLGWAGTLPANRLNSNVVQSVQNDTNITGTVLNQVLTLGFTSTLSKARQNGATVYNDQSNTYALGTTQTLGGQLVINGATSGSAFINASATGSKLLLNNTNTNVSNAGDVTAATLAIGNVTGSTQCLHVNTSGQVTGTGFDCASVSGGGVTSIAGTPHQVIASASTGSVTLSTPQNIDTTSTVQFATETITNGLTVSGGAESFTGHPFSVSAVSDSGNSFSLSIPGVFTNTQSNENTQSLINGCSPHTELQAVQGSQNQTDALTGCLAFPGATATVYQGNAIAGYANTNGSGASNTQNVVAGYFSNRVTGNGGHAWGINPVVIDTAGLTSGVKLLNEFDVQPQNAASAYSTINGLLMNFFAPALADGTTFANAFAFDCAKGQTGGIWQACYSTSDGAAGIYGLIGSVTTSASSNSQPLNANIRDAGNVIRTLSLFGDSTGAWTVNTFNGKVIIDKAGVQTAVLDPSNNTGGASTYILPNLSGGSDVFMVRGIAETVSGNKTYTGSGNNFSTPSTATSGANFPFPTVNFNASDWSGSAAVASTWAIGNSVNASGTPTFDLFQFSNAGSQTTNIGVQVPHRLYITTTGGGSSVIESETSTSNVLFQLPNTATNPTTLADLNIAETFTANQTFSGGLSSTSTTALSGPITATGTDSGAQTVSGNKTYTGSGNNFSTPSTATSGANFAFPTVNFNASDWSGSAAVTSTWGLSNNVSASGVPTVDLVKFSNSGSQTANIGIEIPHRLYIDTTGGGSSVIESETATSNVLFQLPNTSINPSTLADLNVAGTWSANQTNVPLVTPTVGGGDTINKIIFKSGQSLNSAFTSIAANACQEQNIAVAGAVTTGVATVQPSAFIGGAFIWTGWVSGGATVTVRICNVTIGAATPTSVTWNVMVVQ